MHIHVHGIRGKSFEVYIATRRIVLSIVMIPTLPTDRSVKKVQIQIRHAPRGAAHRGAFLSGSTLFVLEEQSDLGLHCLLKLLMPIPPGIIT